MPKQNKLSTSAAHIEVPQPGPDEKPSEARQPASVKPDRSMSKEEVSAVFRGLRELLRKCGNAPKTDRAIVLIEAIIEQGWNTQRRILGTCRTLGFAVDYTSVILRQGTGSDPRRHRWARDEQGVYTVHAQVRAASPNV